MTPEQISNVPIQILQAFPQFSDFSLEQLESMDQRALYSQLDGLELRPHTPLPPLDSLTTTLDVFKRYLHESNVEVGVYGATKNDKFYPTDRLIRDFTPWYQTNGIKRHLTQRSHIDEALSILHDEAYDNEKQKLWCNIKGEPNDTIYVSFSNELGLSNTESLALRWWMTDAKRRARDLAESEEVDTSSQVPYPVFYGKQGSGKTYLTRSLKKVFGDLSAVKKAKDIMDDFGQIQYGKLLIVDFDDISQIDHKHLAQLKSWVTSDTLTPRIMRSERQHYIKKISTGIASSNQPLAKVIPDTTGSRRFFQIEQKKDWVKAIKNTNFEDLWRSLDIEWYPTVTEREEIRQAQDTEQRNKHPIELFYEEVYSDTTLKTISSSKLFLDWNDWIEHTKGKEISQKAFGMNITQYLINGSEVLSKKRTNKGMVYEFLQNNHKSEDIVPEAINEPQGRTTLDFTAVTGYSV
ncbi:VapE domain-containing protein [Vibrio breoganii]